MKNAESLNQIYGPDQVIKHPEMEIYRCVKKNALGQAFEIDYVDFTGNWITKELESYLESVLNKDYYSSEGYLQWNFYYYFISQTAEIAEHRREIRTIEKDDAFARKRVFTFEDFQTHQFGLQQIGLSKSQNFEKDLYSTWVDELRKEDLHFVYEDGPKNFKKPVEDYIYRHKTGHTKTKGNNKVQQEVAVLNKIIGLELKSYRRYPEERNFKFGQVVLVHGANATGKTSFLDAIELSLTGKCSRQEDKVAHDLLVRDREGILYLYPDQPKNYTARDEKWYKSYLNRGNNLNGNFNRFNYFTSDAAYDLKKQDDDSKYYLEEIIADIALGQEVNKLEEKIAGFKNKFEEYYITLGKDKEKLQEEISTRELEIASIEDKNTLPNQYKEKFLEEMLNRSWSVPALEDENEFIQQTAALIAHVDECLVSINGVNISATKITKQTTELQFEEMQQVADQIAKAQETIYKQRISLTSQEKRLTDCLSKKKILEGLEKYFANPNHDQLQGIGDRIEKVKVQGNKLSAINQLFQNLLITDSFMEVYQGLTVRNIGDQVGQRRIKVNTDQRETMKSIADLEDGVNRLNHIISEIKASAGEFLILTPDAEQCPLCGTDFKRYELAEAIEQAKSQLGSDKILQNLKDKRESNRTLIVTLEFEQMVVDRLKEITILNSSWENLNLGRLLSEMRNVPAALKELEKIQFDLESVRSSFQSNALSEEDYVRLLLSWSNFKDEFIAPNEVAQYLEAVNTELLEQKKEAENTQDLIDQAQMELAESYGPSRMDDKAIATSLTMIENALRNFEILERYMSFGKDKRLVDLIEDHSYVRAAHGLYSAAFNDSLIANRTIQELRLTITENQVEIERITPFIARAKKALDVLSRILRQYNKNMFLREYINGNRKEIVEIFLQIHSPKEFNDIEFRGKRIYLRSGATSHSLDMISTGQRAALALSIFLSLNRKLQHGPNLLMLDDPIAYVDDLNILSFLDYLRALVINSGKQIIFVTANTDLAFLFKMKFGFMGETDLSVFEFERTE
jgi:exonuclease SbcC